MTRNLYALLIGIDTYKCAGIPSLQGCVNDVDAMEEYLSNRLDSRACQLHLQRLTTNGKDEKPTKQAIITGIEEHLCKATDKDVALFYFSGHGSQESAPPEFWHLEPDRKEETLVCWDSRSSDHCWDLADKELAFLIGRIAKKNPHILFVLDCCHSGSGTRDVVPETGVRHAPADGRARTVNDFLFTLQDLEAIPTGSTAQSAGGEASGWNLPQGRHVLLSGCRNSELAQEYPGDGKQRGAFSYFLLDTLHKGNGSLTYRELFRQVSSRVRSGIKDQTPQLEAPRGEDLELPFLGAEGAIARREPTFTVSQENSRWVLDAGAVHGMSVNTELALYPLGSSVDQMRKLAEAIGTAEVIEVRPQQSVVELTTKDGVNPGTVLNAVITSLPLPPMGVVLEGEEEALDAVRQELQKIGIGGVPSLYVREVNAIAEAQYRLLAEKSQYVITKPADRRPLVRQIEGYGPANARNAVEQLEHMARWTAVVQLEGSPGSRIGSDAVKMEFYQPDGSEIQDSPIRLSYQLQDGKWKAPSFRVKLSNTSEERLFCTVLVLGENYSIKPPLFAESNNQGVWIEPGTEVWAYRKKEITASVRDELWKQGSTEYQDVLKLIACTAEFDASLMCQDGLELEHPRTQTRSIPTIPKRSSTLNRLMQRVSTRDIGAEDIDEVDEWMTSQVTVITTRPQDSVAVSQETPTSLGMGVTLAAHSALEATARLTTVSQSTRDVGNMILPAILQENTQPFPFTASRGVDPGLSALELKVMDARALDSVTPQQPLVLTVEKELGANEVVLPIAFDGEFFQPLGRGEAKDGKTEIRIERLIHPLEQKTKSLGGSIRIFFQKVVAQKLGLDFPYPILAVVDHDAEEKPIYIGEAATVEARVADASRIILFLHGIIGDTQSIVPCVRQKIRELGEGKCLNDIYDLVMTFDYENLNTPIEELAQQLGQRLARVGLGPNHGKTLHIVAHSMGGLVSRSFIEQRGGHEVVQHLIMVGTPNGGSPWSTVQDWAFTALTLGLNGLAVSGFPIAAVGNLLGGVEAIDVNLDQMKPGSDFLTSLLTSPDPGVPYTILAGDTSLIKPTDDESSNRLQNLLKKLGKGAIEFPFLDQPNDIAASVYSIKKLPTERAQQPRIQDVACNHLVYFTHPEGLRALAEAVIATGILGEAQPTARPERPAAVPARLPATPRSSPPTPAGPERNDLDSDSSKGQSPTLPPNNWFDKTHAILIGIDSYHSSIDSLEKAVSDAKKMSEIIIDLNPTEQVEYYVSYGPLPGHANDLIYPKNATQFHATNNGFLELLSHLESHVKKNDRIILYFAGHGYTPPYGSVESDPTSSNGHTMEKRKNKPQGYLFFQDAVGGKIDSYFGMDVLIDKLERLECRHGLIILDCCYGGAVEWSVLRNSARDIGVDHVTPSLVDRYIGKNAWQILTSSSENQKTYEDAPMYKQTAYSNRGTGPNSPFVMAFHDALINRKAEYKKTGFTYAKLLSDYLRTAVEDAIGPNKSSQTPCLIPFSLKHEQTAEFVFLLDGMTLVEVKGNLDKDPDINSIQNPYIGLSSYSQDLAAHFYGRERSIEELHKAVIKSKDTYPFTVVLGASGSGKSSLVCAGLIPKLLNETHPARSSDKKSQVQVIRPGQRPGRQLERALNELNSKSMSSRSQSLLVIDQLEEVVTHCNEVQEKDSFWGQLHALVTSSKNEIIIVATLRSDYEYIVKQEFETAIKRKNLDSSSTIWIPARYPLQPMKAEELSNAIRMPALRQSVYFSDEKNQRGNTIIDEIVDSVQGMPGALPLLSVALETIYNSFKERYIKSQTDESYYKRTITWDDYNSLGDGGVLDLVRKKAYTIYNQLDPNQQMILRWMMMRMITLNGNQPPVRRQVFDYELDYPKAYHNKLRDQVLVRFDKERLVVPSSAVDGQRFYELAHDVLAIEWDYPDADEVANNQESDLSRSSILSSILNDPFIRALRSFQKPLLNRIISTDSQHWNPMSFNQDALILLQDISNQSAKWQQPHPFSNATQSNNANLHEQQQ